MIYVVFLLWIDKIFVFLNSSNMTVVFVGFQGKVSALRSAKACGLRVILLLGVEVTGFEDYVDEVYRVRFSDMNGLKKVLDEVRARENVDAVLTNYEVYTVYKAFVAQYLGLKDAKLLDACSARNKVLMREKWKGFEANIDYRVVRNVEEALEAFDVLGEDVFLKFISGVKSSFIYHVRSEDEMKQSFEELTLKAGAMNPAFLDFYDGLELDFEYPDPRKVFLVEKAEYGRQVTMASVIGEGEIYHAPGLCDVYTAQDIDRDDSFLAFRILPSQQSFEVERRARSVVEEAVRALGVKNCLLHSELILKEDGSLKLIEIAARVGGYRARMYQAAYGIDLYKALFDMVSGKKPNFVGDGMRHVSLMEIFPQAAGKFLGVDGVGKLDFDDDVLQWKILPSEGDKVGTARDGNKRVMDLVLSGESYDEVYRRSMQLQQDLVVKVGL